MEKSKSKGISGKVYIIVGSAVILMSLFVGINNTGIEKMSLFILVGAIFIVVGFVKIISQEKKAAPHLQNHSHHGAHHAQHSAHKSTVHNQTHHTQQGNQHSVQHHSPHHAQHTHHAQNTHHAQHTHHAQNIKPPYHHSPSAQAAHAAAVMKCPGCGTKIHPSFRHCHNCGHKLK